MVRHRYERKLIDRGVSANIQRSVAPSPRSAAQIALRRRAQLASTDAGYDALVARYNGLLIRALNDVSDQVSALTSVRAQIVLEKRAEEDAQKSWNDAIKAYRGGLKGPLTPLASRQQLLLTQQRLALLESQQTDISVRLIEALGGGFDGTAEVAQVDAERPQQASSAKNKPSP